MNIAPTKSNQLKLRRDLDMATEGFALLDQKREILIMELMRLLDRVRSAHKRIQKLQSEAYPVLKRAIACNGYHRMCSIASGISYEHSVRERPGRVVAGVRVPEFSVEHGSLSSQFGFSGSDSLTDQTMDRFLELLEAVGEMAQLETSAWLLARELKRTQRRVNALEQIFIPDFESSLRYIGESLESKELQAFSIMKMIKQRAQEKR
jgi:V/A-type H+-transporting ATPase subunit D